MLGRESSAIVNVYSKKSLAVVSWVDSKKDLL